MFELFANEKTRTETTQDACPPNSSDYCAHCSNSEFQNGTVILDMKELKNLDEDQIEKQDLGSKGHVPKCTCWKASDFHIQFCGKNIQEKSVYIISLPFSITRTLIDFCYTGKIEQCDNRTKLLPDALTVLSDAALHLGLSHLDLIINAMLKDNFQYASDLSKVFFLYRSQNIRKLCIDQEYFSDVFFQVDDGIVHGHKILLSSGCDVMKAMFAGRFMESENKQVNLDS